MPPDFSGNIPEEASQVEVTTESQPQPQPQPQPGNRPGPSHASSETLIPGQDTNTRPMSGRLNSTPPSKLSIFSCLDGVVDPDSNTINEEALSNHLREVDDYLRSETSFSDRRAYATCPGATRDEVYAYLRNQGDELSGNGERKRGRERGYETRIDIANAADVVLKFFFPPHVEVPTISKFWGAVKMAITVSPANSHRLTICKSNLAQDDSSADGDDTARRRAPQSRISEITIRILRLDLRSLCVELQTLNELIAHAGQREKSKIKVPNEVIEGWIHLLMSLIYMLKDYEKGERLLDHAKTLVRSGMASVVCSLSAKPLLDNSVILPLELLSLLNLKLLQDVTVGRPNISECYSASLKEMVGQDMLAVELGANSGV